MEEFSEIVGSRGVDGMECLDDERADGGVALCSFIPVAEMDNPARLQTFSVTVLTS